MKSEMNRQSGVLMIEVLITILIVSIGLLGIAAMFVRSQVANDEAYQRHQALDIAHQLSEQLSSNRTEAAKGLTSTYVTGDTGSALPGDTGFSRATACTTCTSDQMAAQDLTAFHDTIVGAQKTQAGNRVAALVAARGCVEFLGTVGNLDDPARYRITVVWQGRQASAAVPAGGSACGGLNLYGADRLLRRLISLEVQVL